MVSIACGVGEVFWGEQRWIKQNNAVFPRISYLIKQVASSENH
jgi:hypothetical protein